jgi:hypothetical protein
MGKPKTARKRPASVTVVALLLFFDALLMTIIRALVIWWMVPEIAQLLPTDSVPFLRNLTGVLEMIRPEHIELQYKNISPLYEGSFDLIVGLLGLFFTFNFFRLKSWGWTWLMLYNGFVLITQFNDYFHGQRDYIALFISALVILLMNQREIRATFNIDRKNGIPRLYGKPSDNGI